MKNTKTISFIFSLILSLNSWADGAAEITKISDYKKVLIQFMKPIDLQLSQFVRDTGRSSGENKSPNYRLLFESAKLQGPEEADVRASCTVYQKTMLSNRVKNYTEEAAKFEKTITEKIPSTISSDIQWTITKAVDNEKGFMLWVSGEKKTMQIGCEKKNSKGEELQMNPKDVFATLSTNEVRFFKDGSEIKPSAAKVESVAPVSASSDTTGTSP